MEKTKDKNKLKRGLTNRHIQLIALGGAVGTGLFLGIGPAAVLAGPSVILGYGIAGLIAFFIMRQLGEMVVQEPVSGSFSHFAFRYLGTFAGYASGWNYWALYILVSMSELTAIGIYIQYWWPDIPLWVSSLFFFVAITTLNLGSVKLFGEAEFWFSIIKVGAIIAMIAFGIYLLFSGTGGPQATVENLTNNGGFFPKGLWQSTSKGYEGLIAVMAIVMFSFGGLELIGITAAEAENPEKTIPKATNQVIYRILIFYIGALIVLFSLAPWETITTKTSPFVTVFDSLKGMKFIIFGKEFSTSQLIANSLNIIVLTAALSVYNSSVYSNSRMLYGLAKQGNAPKFLLKLNRNSAPIRAILVSSAFAGVSIFINKIIPEQAFEILMSLVVSCLIINWIMISVTHLKFRSIQEQQKTKLKFPSLLYPFSNYISIIFLTGILGIMCVTGMHISVILIPIWGTLLFISHKIMKRNPKTKP